MTDVDHDPAVPDGSDQPDDTAPTGDDTGPTTEDKAARRRHAAIEWIVLIGAALIIALVVKTFLFQAFYIPSESMVPTLKVGDRVLVNKLSYDLHDVNRGDIIVFSAPPEARSDGINDLVKRVIGLPGDTVEGREDGLVYVNDRLLDEPYLPEGTPTRAKGEPEGCTSSGTTFRCKVPAGHYFMMGDNREASLDSRAWGPIEKDAIVGRVFVRIWPPRSIGLM